jgi:hypothetical protein
VVPLIFKEEENTCLAWAFFAVVVSEQCFNFAFVALSAHVVSVVVKTFAVFA